MVHEFKQADESALNYATDAVMQETPSANHFVSPKKTPKANSIFEDRNSPIEEFKFKINETSQAHASQCFCSPLTAKDIEVKGLNNESLQVGDESFHHSPPISNRRTPDLDKIAEFFQRNRTPKQSKLLAQLESTELQDTPESQRRNFSVNLPKINKKTSSTEFIRGPRRVNEEQCSEDTVADLSYKSNIRKSEKSLEFIKDAESWRHLKFFDGKTDLGEKKTQLQIDHMEPVNKCDASKYEIHSNGVQNSKYSENSEKSKKISLINSDPRKVYEGQDNDGTDNEVSRLNDTTDGDLSVQWVFRSHTHELYNNSNRSTQIIDPPETQEDNNTVNERETLQNGDTISRLADDTQTQLVASFNCQGESFLNETGDVDSSTQVVRSPEQLPTRNTQGTPSTSSNLFIEAITEVPETSSPPKPREVIDIASSANSSISGQQVTLNETEEQEKGSQERVFLQISNRPEHFPSQEMDQSERMDTKKEMVAAPSEVELTQDLPEVEEQGTQEKKYNLSNRSFDTSFENSQEITKKTSEKRRKNDRVIMEEEVDEGYRNHPRKKLRRSSPFNKAQNQMRTPDKSPFLINQNETSPLPFLEDSNGLSGPPVEDTGKFPQAIKSQDDKFLSKEDIGFEDAVWCQYDLNYSFYPGRLLSYDESSDGCWVVFNTGKSLTKNDDIYYLDIRVGDTVNWKGKPHSVVALECRTNDLNVIRCIRGFDTVHLRRRKVSATLGKRSFVVPLSSISLDVNEWTKRPKVILEEGSHTRAKAFKFLQHPIRGRKNIVNISPRKARVESEKTRVLTYKENSEDESCESDTSSSRSQLSDLSSKIGSPHIKKKLLNSKELKIFERCIFVLSGLNQDKDELLQVIEDFGGTVLELGFLELFDYECLDSRSQQMGDAYLLNLFLKSDSKLDFGNFKFACLLSEKHLRSLKYLETLALGWPTVHWNFIEECLRKAKLCTENLHQYLLPSGESHRLAADSHHKLGVIKSSNIFDFYETLLRGGSLRDQVSIKKSVLCGYTILLYGHSELDQFIRFVLACFGVKQVFQFAGKIENAACQNLDPLTKRLNFLLAKDKDCRIIFYINGDSAVSDTILEENKRKFWKYFANWENLPTDFHVESKEWLIQTVINEHAGFGEKNIFNS